MLKKLIVHPLLVAGIFGLSSFAAVAGPICTPPLDKSVCGGRIFPEPLNSLYGLTYRETVEGLNALANEHPDWAKFYEFGSGSADGLSLYALEITSPDSSIALSDRKIVLVNQSIHGNEPGGREGGVRYAEDLLMGLDPERSALLDRVRFIQTFINPDGWASGDHDHVQSGGGGYLWVRQNGNAPFNGAGDLGLGTDLNRQAPWRGISHSSGPVSQPESIAFAEFVRQLAAQGDIQVSADIHGEVTDAAAWVMLSAGQFNLDQALNQRYHGEAIHAAIEASLENSTASALIETVMGDVAPTVLTASSEFGSIASETTSSGSGFQGDWIAQPEGGDSASLSTIELYNFIGTPGVGSLTARPDVLQYYRDVVRGILRSFIEQAAVEHDTRMQAGRVLWLDDAPRIADPVREGVLVSSADFFRDLEPWFDGELIATDHTGLISALQSLPDATIITTAKLQNQQTQINALHDYVQAGGQLVLTDDALKLLPQLVSKIADEDISLQLDNGGKVSYDRSHPLTSGIRQISWMNTETASMGLKVEGSDANVPTWRVASHAWESAGGTTAGVSGDGFSSVGSLNSGHGQIHIIGVLLPTPDGSADNIQFGINGYGVVDTGYIVLANALGAKLLHSTSPAVVTPEGGFEQRERSLSARGGAMSGFLILLFGILTSYRWNPARASNTTARNRIRRYAAKKTAVKANEEGR